MCTRRGKKMIHQAKRVMVFNRDPRAEMIKRDNDQIRTQKASRQKTRLRSDQRRKALTQTPEGAMKSSSQRQSQKNDEENSFDAVDYFWPKPF